MSPLLESWYADLRARGIDPRALTQNLTAAERLVARSHRDRDAEIERREGWDTQGETHNGR